MEKGGKDGRSNLAVFTSDVGRILVPRLPKKKRKHLPRPPEN